MIDWKNPECLVTPHFTIKDCLWLPQWHRLANESDGFLNYLPEVIEITCRKLEQVRTILNCPMNITSFYRPVEYSPLVGGSAHDVHTLGLAADFTTEPNLSIEDAKDLLRPHLEDLDLRMEKGTTTWIHIDRYRVGQSGREFTP